ncbi:MAG: hypothetical protein QSU88_06550, partial [Candidatus Methanoperedens sp.]|nr:hypothetical protein [Candidatus Methanoperedens sp.]
MARKRKKKGSNNLIFVILIFILMVMILVGALYIYKNPALLDGFPNKSDKQPASIPAVTPITVISPNNTIKLAAFNLQIFGTSKAGNREVMDVLSKTIRNFDIV